MALGIHNQLSNRLINDFGEFVEMMFQGVQRPCEHIFCTLCLVKSDLDEVA
jgi:hypothetical protein